MTFHDNIQISLANSNFNTTRNKTFQYNIYTGNIEVHLDKFNFNVTECEIN